jgi:hypothetical protein
LNTVNNNIKQIIGKTINSCNSSFDFSIPKPQSNLNEVVVIEKKDNTEDENKKNKPP